MYEEFPACDDFKAIAVHGKNFFSFAFVLLLNGMEIMDKFMHKYQNSG